ncbi:molybdopterin molybdotransferase MoeA [Desulforhopalus sp. IMCC35007]|uniref:molybdopterin molybdotransferase MoeA n=1 Tax=Desulforhopalus sp. IMCC35007 TaxID=2569543 RepID=UPI00145CBA87|nr:molybdopterin molybdotransferase MoeA [Desulforhopalus sp. IMCC35007]
MKKVHQEAGEEAAVATENTHHSAHAQLFEIRRRIFSLPMVLKRKEDVLLRDAISRVAAENLQAKLDVPLFDESLRDGFAISAGEKVACDGETCFQIAGVTGAGDVLDKALKPGEAWLVMTGGKVPGDCTRIIPKEWCAVEGQRVTIRSKYLTGPSYIKRRGEERQKGAILVEAGEVITPASLVKIAEGGWHKLAVYRRPRVSFCCTGKELVESGVLPEDAQKISSNKYLLVALIEQCGCLAHDYGIVTDEEKMVGQFFTDCLDGSSDLVLTTGGTGGGDFDLVEKGFLDAGGTLTCTSLDLRPGRSTVAGEKNGVLYVGLPGPPKAVHTVFLEVVAPLLQEMSGVRPAGPRCIEAFAGEDITAKTKGALLIKEGVLSCIGGQVLVQRATRNEHPNCNILIAPGRDHIKKGEIVEVHLRQPLWG